MKPIRIGSWNVCLGMFHKINLIKHHINRDNLDILLINEAEINVNHDHRLLSIKGYDLITPNGRQSTRIAAYVKSNLSYTVNNSDNKNDSISITIDELKILGIYRGFKLGEHLNATEQILSLGNEISDHDVIIGDINLDYNKLGVESYRFSGLYNMWTNFINTKEFHQVNNKPTWSRQVNETYQESVLDHIYLKLDMIRFQIFQTSTSSDHDLIGVEINNILKAKKQPETFYVRKWSDYNQQNVTNELAEVCWSNSERMNSQDHCDFMDQTLSTIVEKITPTRMKKSKICRHLWNDKIDKLIKNKQTLKRRLRRTPTDNLRLRIKQVNEKI